MGEYDAVWVFIISAIFVGFYIFIEARPKGSTFLNDISISFFSRYSQVVTSSTSSVKISSLCTTFFPRQPLAQSLDSV